MARESTIGSIFYLETLPASAAVDVTALGAGTTTLVTTALTAAIGDFIVLRNTGSKILDRLTMHRVSATGVGTLTIDTDTTGETFDITAETEAYKVGIQEVCFSEFGLDAPAPTEVDVTTMCDTERKNVPGLANTGSANFGGPLDLSDAGQKLLITAYKDALARNMAWVTRGGQTGLMYGVVSSFTAAPQGVEQAVTFSGTFQVQESAVYLEPLVV